MDVKPGRFRLAVSVGHTVEFPAVTLIESGMVGYKINRRNSLGSHVLYRHVQKFACYALGSVFRFSENGADIGIQILSVMEVIIDHAHAGNDLIAIHADIPAVFGRSVNISIYAFKISFLGHSSALVEPFGSHFVKLRALP